MRFVATIVAVTSLLLQGLDATDDAPKPYGSSQDPSSYANVDQFAPKHISFDFEVNFADSSTSGTVTHLLHALEAGVNVVYFDVWDAVEVSKAEFRLEADTAADFVSVEFDITTPNPNIGNALAVTLPSTANLQVGDAFLIRFTYKSLPETTALSWLTPTQTAGKKQPFVYSLCQMNFCRDWAPMMDTPSQKITYSSRVVAPTELVVSMSGNKTSTTAFNDTHSVTTFECLEKIPSYQLALIIGDVVSRRLSDRIVVWAEEPYIDAAAKEFEDLPAIFDSTELYLTPYIWGEYSIFVMPPSFPWGGMEHINANQVSHTLIAGDKSMLSIVIHEVTHSWFGNDVGCLNWNHFWINEGMNVFMERKVLEDFYGRDFTLIDYYTGNITMVGDMTTWLGGLDHPYSSLFPDIGDDDPENSFSNVPYEKGSQFMFYIETLIGADMMQFYLQDYIVEFHGMAISAPTHKEFYESWVRKTFPDTAETIIADTMWDKWVYEPGVAPVPLNFYTEAIDRGRALAMQYVEMAKPDVAEQRAVIDVTEYFGYYGSQKVAFVQELAVLDGVDVALMAAIDADLNISLNEINPDAKNEWYVLGIKKGYETVLEPAHKWVGEQGRSAYVRPIFRALINDAKDCETASAWFEENKDFYNSYVRIRVERNLNEGCPVATSNPTASASTVWGVQAKLAGALTLIVYLLM